MLFLVSWADARALTAVDACRTTLPVHFFAERGQVTTVSTAPPGVATAPFVTSVATFPFGAGTILNALYPNSS